SAGTQLAVQAVVLSCDRRKRLQAQIAGGSTGYPLVRRLRTRREQLGPRHRLVRRFDREQHPRADEQRDRLGMRGIERLEARRHVELDLEHVTALPLPAYDPRRFTRAQRFSILFYP